MPVLVRRSKVIWDLALRHRIKNGAERAPRAVKSPNDGIIYPVTRLLSVSRRAKMRHVLRGCGKHPCENQPKSEVSHICKDTIAASRESRALHFRDKDRFTTVATGVRKPRVHGTPPIFVASIMMRSNVRCQCSSRQRPRISCYPCAAALPHAAPTTRGTTAVRMPGSRGSASSCSGTVRGCR